MHNAAVGFCLKKMGEKDSLRTQANSTHIKNVSSIYGNDIAKELLEIEFDDDALQIKVKSLITNVNYSSKKGIFILFINHRLVESVGKYFSVQNRKLNSMFYENICFQLSNSRSIKYMPPIYLKVVIRLYT